MILFVRALTEGNPNAKILYLVNIITGGTSHDLEPYDMHTSTQTHTHKHIHIKNLNTHTHTDIVALKHTHTHAHKRMHNTRRQTKYTHT